MPTITPPPPAAIMPRAASRLQRKVPVRLTSITARHCSSDMSTMGLGDSTPALQTTTSIAPSAVVAWAKPVRTESSLDTSTRTATAGHPAAVISSTIPPAVSGSLRYPSATAAPWAASS